MANEAIRVEGPYEVHDFTVADATAISQYTLCKLADPRTALSSSADGDIFCGVAASDKEASDGRTNLGLYTRGIFVLKDNGGAGIAVGARVSLGGANTIKTATEPEVAAGKDFGVALEAIASGTSGEVMILR